MGIFASPSEMEWMLTQIINEDLIPREFLTSDKRAIWKLVSELGAEANIPGVRVFER